ncbi:MAG TPA: MerR family transcriptional regulator [Cyclobacteriaceae bacterium]|nr:MerR family transcriptional regulator [Cyclobacteriaceae bacterium]
MGKYSIKELERLSGIKAHTIRIWEKRHKLIEPSRTSTNIRYYSDDDLKKIINVSLLNNHGVKISHIADLDHEQLVQKVLEFTEKKSEADIYINQVIVSMIDLDEEQFEIQLNTLADKFGMEKTITDVIFPFLDRIGILWQTGNITPAQEHFVSNLVRQKLLVAVDKLPIPPKTAKSAVLFLPEYELHEIGLLFCYYILKKAGIRVFYLGQMVPYEDLKSIGRSHHPNFFVTSMISERLPKDLQNFVNTLSSDFPNSTIIATGGVLNRMALSFPPNFHLAANILKVKDFV